MAINKSEVSKYLYFKIPKSLKDEEEEIKEEIGNYVLEAILDKVGEGVSPVTGKPFKQLSKKYAETEKKGDRLANLDLNGDMLDSLEFEITDNGIKIGIMDEEQAIKAYAHNTGYKGHPVLDGKVPPRKFIPAPNENFEKSIMKEIEAIIKEHEANASEDNEEL